MQPIQGALLHDFIEKPASVPNAMLAIVLSSFDLIANYNVIFIVLQFEFAAAANELLNSSSLFGATYRSIFFRFVRE